MRPSLYLLPLVLALSGCAATTTLPSLEGTSWRLAAFESSDDATGTLRPDGPERYTLSFGKDGILTAKLDCNRGSGPWHAERGDAGGGRLSLGPLATTRAMCQPDPIGTRLTNDIDSLRSYRLQDGRLYTGLPADAGVYVWHRIAP